MNLLQYSEGFRKSLQECGPVLGGTRSKGLILPSGTRVPGAEDYQTLKQRFPIAYKLADVMLYPERYTSTYPTAVDWKTGKNPNKPYDAFFTKGQNAFWLRAWVADTEKNMHADPPYDDSHKVVFSSGAANMDNPVDTFAVLTPSQRTELCGQLSCVNVDETISQPGWITEEYGFALTLDNWAKYVASR